ncbi:hypothetical protein [Sodalis ligni]|uniref:Uncharacterized protein n=1 Tax=Sodalis ligni TaxID=2697027 RepID=A0A4R1NI50_9GAMM|nr:hypothetical protein [Sodalis ligni]TCL07322.1 hypothetical protein EZJ58_5638 [Sodalis ligni]
MATIPTQNRALFSSPLSSTTDFTVLTNHCEQFAEILLESSNPAQRQLLCAKMAHCLALLQSTMGNPIPPHLVERLTVDEPPSSSPRFEPESDLLCEYCQVLVRLLTDRTISQDMEPTIIGLLFELVNYLADELRAPRWIRTADGVKIIEEAEVSKEHWIP